MDRMDDGPEFETLRLRLRRWSDADLEPFAAFNADPVVMRCFPKTLDRNESDALAARWRNMFRERGFGMWAVEVKGGAPFIGFVGLSVPLYEAHFTPCVETGWVLGAPYWGKGYATEAATVALGFGFDVLGLAEIVAYTAAINRRSQAVMERLGMQRSPADDFQHPLLPAEHTLRAHMLYRIGSDEYHENTSA